MSVLAHQGGWDEALFVVIPLLVIVGLLWLARRRADQMHLRAPLEDGSPPEAPKPGTDDV